MTQGANLGKSSLTIRVTESGVGVGVDCSWSAKAKITNNKSTDTQAFV